MTAGSMEKRTLRKFLRHRPAVVSFVIILMYAITAVLLVMTGWITLDDTTQRVGPMLTPGFGGIQKPEKRLQDVSWLAERVESLAKRKNFDDAIGSFNDLGQRKIAAVPKEELKARLESVWELHDELAESDDLNRPGTQNSDSTAADGSSTKAAILTKLADLEQRTERLLEPVSADYSMRRKGRRFWP